MTGQLCRQSSEEQESQTGAPRDGEGQDTACGTGACLDCSVTPDTGAPGDTGGEDAEASSLPEPSSVGEEKWKRRRRPIPAAASFQSISHRRRAPFPQMRPGAWKQQIIDAPELAESCPDFGFKE
ncbi:unnamed protein product [Rangifer tarandus platyrhynchus]